MKYLRPSPLEEKNNAMGYQLPGGRKVNICSTVVDSFLF